MMIKTAEMIRIRNKIVDACVASNIHARHLYECLGFIRLAPSPKDFD